MGSQDIDSGADSEAGFDSETGFESEGDSEPDSQGGSQAGAAQPSLNGAASESDEEDVGDLSWEAVMAAVQGGGSDHEGEEAVEAIAVQAASASAPAEQKPEKKKVPKARGKHYNKHQQESGGHATAKKVVTKGSSKFVGSKKRPRQ